MICSSMGLRTRLCCWNSGLLACAMYAVLLLAPLRLYCVSGDCVVRKLPHALPVAIDVGDTVTEESNVTYFCERGWYLNDEGEKTAVATCTSAGLWTKNFFCNTPLSCVVETLENAAANRPIGSVIYYGSRVIYSCNDGYEFFNGVETLMQTCVRKNTLAPSLSRGCVRSLQFATDVPFLMRALGEQSNISPTNDAKMSIMVPVWVAVGVLIVGSCVIYVCVACHKKSQTQEYRKNAPPSPLTPSQRSLDHRRQASQQHVMREARAPDITSISRYKAANEHMAFEILYKMAETKQEVKSDIITDHSKVLSNRETPVSRNTPGSAKIQAKKTSKHSKSLKSKAQNLRWSSHQKPYY